MKIPLKQFQGDRSVVIRQEILPSELDIDIGIMHFPEALMLSVEAWKTDDDLTVDAHVEGTRRFTCSRCLEEVNNPFEKDFTLHYDIKGLDSVTIDPDIREEIMLEHPIRILCKPDCRGLCSFCGTNLNDGPCDCKPET